MLSQAQIVEQTNITRIQEAFEAMQEQFYTPTTGLYVGEPVGYSFLWPFSQALAATISLDEIPSLRATYTNEVGARLTGLQLYWDTDNSEEPEGTFASTLPAYDASSAPPTGPGGTKFYDDNEWGRAGARARVQAARRRRRPGTGQADLGVRGGGAVDEPCAALPRGGLALQLDHQRRPEPASNGPAAELAAELYAITAEEQDLRFAEATYNWARTCLLQSNNLYADHIGTKGQLALTFYSYNQGSMIGAGHVPV